MLCGNHLNYFPLVSNSALEFRFINRWRKAKKPETKKSKETKIDRDNKLNNKSKTEIATYETNVLFIFCFLFFFYFVCFFFFRRGGGVFSIKNDPSPCLETTK